MLIDRKTMQFSRIAIASHPNVFDYEYEKIVPKRRNSQSFAFPKKVAIRAAAPMATEFCGRVHQ
jgi:hypothetical protein